MIVADYDFLDGFHFFDNWIQDFPYRVGIKPTPFLLVALGSILVASLAVSFQSFKAAKTNPADTLRME